MNRTIPNQTLFCSVRQTERSVFGALLYMFCAHTLLSFTHLNCPTCGGQTICFYLCFLKYNLHFISISLTTSLSPAHSVVSVSLPSPASYPSVHYLTYCMLNVNFCCRLVVKKFVADGYIF